MNEQINPEELVERKTQETFPNIVISKPNDTIPVVVRDLEKGDIQLIIEFNGKRKVVAAIDGCSENIFMLIRTTGSLIYRKNENDFCKISNIKDYYSCVT